MPSLDETLAELQTRLVDPDLLNPTQADPFFYFVHDPAQTLAVKQKLGYWTAALEKDRWTVERISLSRVLWELVDASGCWEEWLSCEADADQAALNKAIRGVLRDESAMARALEPHLAACRDRTVVFLTDAQNVRRSLESLQDLRGELLEFRDELLRVANLPYRPNLDDGVLINAAPLWRLFRLPKWRGECETCWKKLVAGAYEWAHLAYTIWPERVELVCKGDRSIALEHGLEELYEGVRKVGGRTGRGRAAVRVSEAPPSLPSLGWTPVRQARARGGAPSLRRSGGAAEA